MHILFFIRNLNYLLFGYPNQNFTYKLNLYNLKNIKRLKREFMKRVRGKRRS